MSEPPVRPKIYHITHVENLASILADGGLVSDAAMVARGGPNAGIGLPHIKARRLSLPVRCHPGDLVGAYVPFYFCPRSIMLYLLHRGNHPDLTYRGGQDPIVHLEADLHDVVAWADGNGARWAFSLSNAGAAYARFRSRLASLNEIDWQAVASSDFQRVDVKEGKQAEFLVHGFFPWSLIERIGVPSEGTRAAVESALAGASHRSSVAVKKEWYY